MPKPIDDEPLGSITDVTPTEPPTPVGSIGSRTNGIFAGEAGVIMNEKDSGPWEGIVSGHPRKRKRSRR